MKSLITSTWKKPEDALIQDIAHVLEAIFSKPDCGNMPQLAVLAIYQRLIHEIKRFNGKRLCIQGDISSSRITDRRISRVGILSEDGNLFEVAVICYGVPISMELLKNAEHDFKASSVDRVYLLSTVETPVEQMNEFLREAERIKSALGFELIVDDVVTTISYYLRLLDDTQKFTECFVSLLDTDKSINFEHKQRLNNLIGGLV